MNYQNNNLRGVIINNVTVAMYPYYKDMIEKELSIGVLGFLPSLPEAQVESRRLGLVQPNELANIQAKITVLGENAARYIKLDKLLAISRRANPIDVKEDFFGTIAPECSPKIYVANDEAFTFYYEDNHELLRAYGAKLSFFSPLHDNALSEDADGIILWGGYPELWADGLSKNLSMRESIKRIINKGAPVYAEAGGFVYLQDTLTDAGGNVHPMLGVLKGRAKVTDKLHNFGYAKLISNYDSMLCDKNDIIKAHSFRYLSSDYEGNSFTAVKAGGNGSYKCIAAENNIFAGFPHIHFWSNKKFAKRFVHACGKYGMEKNNDNTKSGGN